MTEEELSQYYLGFPCCAANRFGVLLFRLLPFAVVVFLWRYATGLVRCGKPVVAVTRYGRADFSQCWCKKHIPEPHLNYQGEPLEVVYPETKL